MEIHRMFDHGIYNCTDEERKNIACPRRADDFDTFPPSMTQFFQAY